MTYETDGQCDHIFYSTLTRCLGKAKYHHLPTGLCYCFGHTALTSTEVQTKLEINIPSSEQIEQEWEEL